MRTNSMRSKFQRKGDSLFGGGADIFVGARRTGPQISDGKHKRRNLLAARISTNNLSEPGSERRVTRQKIRENEMECLLC
jgi:hypothetical protein